MTTRTELPLHRLREELAGAVLLPGERAYDTARTLFNAMIDRRPAVIAQCADVEDVQRALAFGRDNGLDIAVRGGGHGVAGRALCDGGLVIDLRKMNAVSVDPGRGTAQVAGGATMGDLDRATQPHGLAAPGGRVSTTGVAGYLLGGGDGWMARKLGLACDSLVEAEIVTADGTLLRANEAENTELFWALHGGGGNFGVATRFTLRLHPLSTITFAFLFWPVEAAETVLTRYRDYMEAAPDDLGGAALLLTGPEEPFVPEALQGRRCLALLVAVAGADGEARPLLKPMLGLGHAGGCVETVPYADFQCMFDDPPGYRNYWSAEYLSNLPAPAVAAFCAAGCGIPVPSPSMQPLFPQGGAIARGPADTPLPWRGAPWAVHPMGMWEDPADDEAGRAWAHGVRAAMQPWSHGAVYLNFLGAEEDAERIVAGWGAGNYARLQRVKRACDPHNVFRNNHNIAPA